MTYKEFDEKYETRQEENGDEIRFDDYNEAIKYVRDNISDEHPYRWIWSAVDGDGELYSLLNGYHIVNVLHYVISVNPWGTDDLLANGEYHLEVSDE